jgi:quinol monooxygenase YgiN
MLRRLLQTIVVALLSVHSLGAQSDPTLYLVSYVEATPASRDQVAALLKQLADNDRRGGAVRAEALQRTTEPNQYVLLEVWKDQQALTGNMGAAGTRQLRERLAPLLLAPFDERRCIGTMVTPPGEGHANVYVVTHIDVPGNSRDAAMQLMRPLVDQSRREPGNVRFDIVHQLDRTNHFTAIEAWSDQKTEDGHELASHTRTFRGGITPLLGALYDQRRYKPL